MSTDDIIQAGAIILKDLNLFNESVVFFEKHIEPKICTEIEACIKGWTKIIGWHIWGDNIHDGLWMAPPDWLPDEEKDHFAGFGFGQRSKEETDSYHVADIFREGETDWGFWFEVEPKMFGGAKKWNAFAKTLNEDIDKLEKIGWCHMGSGSFFLLVPLLAESLPSAWENDNWEEALAPLVIKMDELISAKMIFDGIIARAKASLTVIAGAEPPGHGEGVL